MCTRRGSWSRFIRLHRMRIETIVTINSLSINLYERSSLHSVSLFVWHAFNLVCTCFSQVVLWIILAPSNVVNNPFPPFLWGGRSNSAEVVHQFSLHAEDLNFLASWCKKCYQVGDLSFAWFLKCRISWRAWNLDSLKI